METERKDQVNETAGMQTAGEQCNKEKDTGRKKGKWNPKKHFQKKTGFSSSSKSNYPKLNHIQWYVLDQRMMDDIGSYPFGYPIGKPVVDNGNSMKTAGIAVLKYCPSVPGTGEAWRMAATRFETTVRAKNSRSATYTGNDLLMSQCCYASVYSAYAYLVKHMGLLKFYSYKNDYLTQALITSLGCNYRDLVSNQANYRDQINQLGRDLMSLLFIKGMTLFDRWTFLNMNLFTDTDSAKTQIYQFKPTCVWKWTPKTSQLGSSLTGVDIPLNYNLSQLIDIVRSCIDSLRGDDDIKYMNADIAKAYPDNEVVEIKPIDSTFTVDLFGNTNIKDQIQNARIVNIVRSNIVPTDITNSAKMTYVLEPSGMNGLASEYLINDGGAPSTILTTDDVDPTSEDVIVKSRFMNTFELEAQGVDQDVLAIKSGSCGSEIINEVDYITDATDATATIQVIGNGVVATRDVDHQIIGVSSVNAREMLIINSFRWHCYYRLNDTGSGFYLREYPSDNFTVLSPHNLEKMNNSIAVAMLNIIPASNTGVKSL